MANARPYSNDRRSELEKRLNFDPTISEDRKRKQLDQLGRTESSFLRLRRTRLGLDDFRTVKVIGKGAFGEVRPFLRSLVPGSYARSKNAIDCEPPRRDAIDISYTSNTGSSSAEGRYG